MGESWHLPSRCTSAVLAWTHRTRRPWARLGRARWLSDKYNLGSLEGLRAAEEAFQTALRLNPSLTLAHNLYTPYQVDRAARWMP